MGFILIFAIVWNQVLKTASVEQNILYYLGCYCIKFELDVAYKELLTCHKNAKMI